MRGLKVFASIVIVLLLTGFMAAYGQDDTKAKTEPKAATAKVDTPTRMATTKVEPDPLEYTKRVASEARKKAEEDTGQKLPIVTYKIEGDGGTALITVLVVVAVIAIIVGVVALVVAIFALRGREADEDEEEGEPEADDLDDIFVDDELEPDADAVGGGEAGRGLIGLLLSIAAIGLIIALLAPSVFAFSDKAAREMALNAAQASEANMLRIDTMKAKIDEMVANAKAEIAKAVEEAKKGTSEQAKKNADAIAYIRQAYVKQGGPEERRLLTAVVQAAGVDLAANPELKKLVEGFCGGKAQWAKFYELMAAAMPNDSGVEDLQRQLNTTNKAVKQVAEGVSAIARAQSNLASKDFVAGAVAESNELLRREMANNLKELKALVEGLPKGGGTADAKIDAVAKASVLANKGEVEASLDSFVDIYGKDWVDQILDSIPAPTAD